MKFDIIIIGGGASGLMAAIGASSSTKLNKLPHVAVLEKMPRPARKMMITGKGRCNFTNMREWDEFSAHIRTLPRFLKPSFYEMAPQDVFNLLQQHGLECVVERGERAYPASHKASDVIDTLVRIAQKKGNVDIYTNYPVTGITCNESSEGPIFMLSTGGSRTFSCKKLILATGGLSYPGTGSTGDGYAWASSFGHGITPLFPSLTALVPKGYKITESSPSMSESAGPQAVGPGFIDRSIPLSETGKSLCGIQLKNVGASLEIDGHTADEEFGDLDFTDGGIEGPIGFRLSRDCVRAIINGRKAAIIINLKYGVPAAELESRIRGLWDEIARDPRCARLPLRTMLKTLLYKLMPQRLALPFMKSCPSIVMKGGRPQAKGRPDEGRVDFREMVRCMQAWRFDIAGYVGYERCVVTAGGVDTSEISAKTMESRKRGGLYFCGEVMDIDSDTGGYNLQTAFSTGYLAGKSAAESLSSPNEANPIK